MSEHFFENNSYSVVFAERRDIGDEWNDVQWDRNHLQIQYHRLYYLTSGNAILHLVDRTIELTTGNIYLIPAFSVLQSEIHGEMNKYYIHFQASSPLFGISRYLSGEYCVRANEMTEGLFEIVTENYARSTQEAYMKVQGAMDLLLSDFFRGQSANRHALLKFEPVLRYIDSHYREPIPLSRLASLMNISTMYFSNFFKDTFHISPKQYILNLRLTEAQRLLLETDLSIKEIAYRVGFENESYFSEFFSAKVGISARKFRGRRLPMTRESIL
ncbi:MAG: helix-turn-helix domain-containing protein [Ruminococcaceae bacterium]|nr:helix-turn-helix domain-containing protein [Oscillospiraceae bacterium]